MATRNDNIHLFNVAVLQRATKTSSLRLVDTTGRTYILRPCLKRAETLPSQLHLISQHTTTKTITPGRRGQFPNYRVNNIACFACYGFSASHEQATHPQKLLSRLVYEISLFKGVIYPSSSGAETAFGGCCNGTALAGSGLYEMRPPKSTANYKDRPVVSSTSASPPRPATP